MWTWPKIWNFIRFYPKINVYNHRHMMNANKCESQVDSA